MAKPLAPTRMALHAAGIILLLLLNKAGPFGNALFFVILLWMVIKSPEAAFKAFTIALLGLVANQAIVTKTAVWTVARFIVPAACFLRYSIDLQRLRYSLFSRGYFIALTAFIVVAGVLTVLADYFVAVALLKLTSFLIGSYAVLSAVQVLQLRKSDITEWCVTVALVIVVLGVATLLVGIGYNGKGMLPNMPSFFNGPFYHSNCLGPIAAMVVVYLVQVIIFGNYRNRWLCVVLAACLVWFMYLTKSRTSFAALIAGILCTVSLSFVLTRRGMVRLRMGVSRVAIVCCLVASVLGVILVDLSTGQTLSQAVVDFVNKGGRSETIDMNQVIASRQALVDFGWNNFLESPYIGIGFEVSKTQAFVETATLFYAPIEKGFLPLAVLEETGLIGATFFTIFLLSYLAYSAGSLNIPGITMFVTFLAVNCGEAMFFAMGGHGALGWLLMAAGMVFGDQCVERIARVRHTAPNQSF